MSLDYNNYDCEFIFPCKRNSDGIPVNINGVSDKQVQTDDDNLESSWEKMKEDYLDESVCSICLENFVTTGEHQVAALKCGHIFGEICIKRWLTEARTEGGPKCPSCKSKAKATDLKLIVPNTIKKSDPSLMNELQEQAAEVRLERIRIETEIAETKEQHEQLKKELDSIKISYDAEVEEFKKLDEIEKAQQIATANAFIAVATKNYRKKSMFQPLSLQKRLNLEAGSDSRVCGFSDMYGVTMFAQKKVSGLCQSFGLSTINTPNWSHNLYIELHQQQIKDVDCHPFDSKVLSASLDKTVKMADFTSGEVAMTFSLEEPVWSCCWNTSVPSTDTFYAGLRNGTIYEYDIRNGGRPKAVIPAPPGISRTPCASIHFASIGQTNGVITTRLQNSTFSYRESDGFVTQLLPASGIFMSSHYERQTDKLLYSARPSKNTPHVTHSLWSLSSNTNSIQDESRINCTLDKCFYGGIHADQVMKGRCFPHPNKRDSCLVFAGDQDIGGLIVWDTLTGEPVQKLGGIGTAFDIAQIKFSSSDSAFIVLTDKSLNCYKWTLN